MAENERSPRRRDLVRFLNALRKQVVAVVCGGVLTGALAVAQGFGWQVGPSWYGIVLCTFFVISAFGAWFEERRDGEKLRSLYGLSLSVEQLISPLNFKRKDDNRELSAIAFIVRINNSGAPTSLTGWRASVTPRGGGPLTLQPTLIGRDVDFGKNIQYGPDDDLLQKTAETPIPQGAIMHGVVLCSGDPAVLNSLAVGAIANLWCFDVALARHDAAINLIAKDDVQTFFPGLGRGDARRLPTKPSILIRPEVKLEISHTYYSTNEGWTSPIVAVNGGKTIAYKVSAKFNLGTVNYTAEIGPVASVGREPIPAMLTLTDNGKTSICSHYNDLLTFITEAMVDAMPAWPEVEFDVVYWDFERHVRYRTPHVLRYSSATRLFVIDLKDTPEPEPEIIQP